MLAHEEAHIVALTAIANLAAVLLCWLLWAVVNPPATLAGADVPLAVFDDFLGAAVTLGLTGTVFALLPLRFLPGGRLAAWHRGAWLATFGAVLFGLLGIVIWPHRVVHGSGAPWLTTVILFLLFASASLAFWWHFRERRRQRDEDRGAAGEGGGNEPERETAGGGGGMAADPDGSGRSVSGGVDRGAEPAGAGGPDEGGEGAWAPWA